jgi:hypothetical protein
MLIFSSLHGGWLPMVPGKRVGPESAPFFTESPEPGCTRSRAITRELGKDRTPVIPVAQFVITREPDPPGPLALPPGRDCTK